MSSYTTLQCTLLCSKMRGQLQLRRVQIITGSLTSSRMRFCSPSTDSPVPMVLIFSSLSLLSETSILNSNLYKDEFDEKWDLPFFNFQTRNPFWLKGNGDLILMDSTGMSLKQEIKRFWPRLSHPICLAECQELALLAGISAIQTNSNYQMKITLLKIDPLKESTQTTMIDLPDNEQVVGIAFDEDQQLLVLAVNEYCPSSGHQKLLKSSLKLANVRSLEYDVVSKQSLQTVLREEELNSPKIYAFRKLEGSNQYCLSMDGIVVCLGLSKSKFKILQKIYGCPGQETKSLIYFPKKIMTVSRSFDEIKMLNFQHALEDQSTDAQTLSASSISELVGSSKTKPIGKILLERGLGKQHRVLFLERLTFQRDHTPSRSIETPRLSTLVVPWGLWSLRGGVSNRTSNFTLLITVRLFLWVGRLG